MSDPSSGPGRWDVLRDVVKEHALLHGHAVVLGHRPQVVLLVRHRPVLVRAALPGVVGHLEKHGERVNKTLLDSM